MYCRGEEMIFKDGGGGDELGHEKASFLNFKTNIYQFSSKKHLFSLIPRRKPFKRNRKIDNDY